MIDLVDKYFLFMQETLKINVQRGFQEQSKEYPLIVYQSVQTNPYIFSYDKGEYGKDVLEKRYFTAKQVQASFFTSKLEKLEESILPSFRDFITQNKFFVFESQNLAVRSITPVHFVPFYLEGQKPVYQATQDLEFVYQSILSQNVEYIDADETINNIKIQERKI